MSAPPLIEHEQLSPREQALARVVLGRRSDWNPDVALRYLPVVRLLRREGAAGPVAEVGCGPSGIAPYRRSPVVGVDTTFGAGPHPRLRALRGSALRLPLRDRSCPTVISVDMLEHLPGELRQPATDELVRVAGGLLVVAVPAGEDAEAHDRAMAGEFLGRRGAQHRYFHEHLTYGLPSVAELRSCIDHACRRHAREATVELLPNAGLRLRTLIVRRWIRQRLVDKAAWVLLVWLAPVLSRLPVRRPYRWIAVVRFAEERR